MDCVECEGKINFKMEVCLMTGCPGCGSFAYAYPCTKCGRLHWPSHEDEIHKTCSGVFNRADEKAYFLNGQIVHK